MSQGAWVLVVALLLATGFGVFRAARDGRFRGTHPVAGDTGTAASGAPSGIGAPASTTPTSSPAEDPAVVAAEPSSVLARSGVAHTLGERATLLQFSSAFCAPCRATRRVLTDVAGTVPGVTHVEVDAEHHLELVRRLGITRTPTTLILDHGGREVSRASGAPAKDAVLTTLARALSV
jgi:thiol-disulfide isomerase/thioredoxin